MINQDPRMVYSNFAQPFAQTLPYAPVYGQPFGYQHGHQQEIALLSLRLEEMRAQIAALNEFILRGQNQNVGVGFGVAGRSVYGVNEFSPIRLRESESAIFWELHLPQLTLGDIEVEIHGTRITCRTRVPVALNRWTLGQLPRGIEMFELNDGRLEFCWIATVPFTAKEVEASFRGEGFLSISIPKAEMGTRHAVKVVRETATTRRASGGDMNS
jgi:hypothetical protein